MEPVSLSLVCGTTAFIAVMICVSLVGMKLVGKALDNVARQPEASGSLSSLFLVGFGLVEVFFLVGILLVGYFLYSSLSAMVAINSMA